MADHRSSSRLSTAGMPDWRPCDGRQRFFTEEAWISSGHESRPEGDSFACPVTPGNANGSGSTKRRNRARLAQLRELDRGHAISRPEPSQNGWSNGCHAAPIEEEPARVASHPDPTEMAPRIVENGVATPLVEVSPETLSSLPSNKRAQWLMEYFRDRVALVLGLAPEKVDPDRPLLNLGLDSLSAMDLKVEVDSSLGTTLPLSMLMEVSGIRELAEWASEHLPGPRTGESEISSPPEPAESDQPLSHEQELLWYAHQFTPSSAAYHIAGAATVRAELHIDALQRALRRVIAHQDALRITFTVVDEKPAIRLLDHSAFYLREDEWLCVEGVAGHSDAELNHKLRELARRPFDLEKGPLFRLHVLSRSAREHIVLLVVHHIIADFWSTAVLVDELGNAYAQELAGGSARLQEPRSTYAEFARWQRSMVPGEEGQRHWAYWQHQLTGPLPVLELPTDFVRPAIQSYQGALEHFELDATLTRAVVALGESRGVSLYTTLLAAFHVFLGRLARAGRHPRRLSGRGTDPAGSRGADRLLRQHGADEGRPLRKPIFRPVPRPRAAEPSPTALNIRTFRSAFSSIGSKGLLIRAGRRCSR